MTSGVGYIGGRHDLLAALRALIAGARESIVLQMYLFAKNGDQTLLLPRPGAFEYAATVAGWLVEKKRRDPGVTIVVLLDSNTPANPNLTRRRGDLVREDLTRAGIIVLTASLFGARFDPRRRRLVRSMNLHLEPDTIERVDWVEHQNRWQFWHNVEDHRKNVVVDRGRAAAITSHNLFDPAYDWHENLFWLNGNAAEQLWSSAARAMTDALAIPQSASDDERSNVAALAALPPTREPPLLPRLEVVENYPEHADSDRSGSLPYAACEARIVEHDAIVGRLTEMFDDAGPGDELRVATTYFSDRPMLDALERAARRGAAVRVLIDSIHALPLPPLASWLTRSLVNHEVANRAAALHEELGDGFQLRVHRSTAGTMMHLKTAARSGVRPRLVGGQANFTPNSFSGAWLETDLEVDSAEIVEAYARHFDRLWDLPACEPVATNGIATRMLRAALLRSFAVLGLKP